MATISVPDLSAFALVFFILIVAVSNNWKSNSGANFIVLSWVSLLIARLPLESTPPFSVELAIYTSTRLLFPILIFMGTLESVNKRVPRAFSWSAAVLITGVYLLLSLGFKTVGVGIAALTNCVLFVGAAWLLITFQKERSSNLLTALSVAYFSFAALSAWGSWALFTDTTHPYYLTMWSLVAGVTAALQFSIFMRGNKRERDLLRKTSDVTAAKLSDLHVRLQSIVENTHDIIIETDDSGNILYITPNVTDLLGYSQEEALSARISDAFHQDDIADIQSWERPRGPDGGQMQAPVRVLHGDGSWHWLESSVRRYLTPSNEVRWVISGRDVTERIQREEQLQNFQTRFDAMALNSKDVILELATDGSLNYITPNASAMTGFQLTQLSRLTVSGILKLLKAEPFISKLGSNAKWKKEFQDFKDSSEPIDKQQKIITADGSTKWIEIEATSYKTASGEPSLLAIIRDITDRIKVSEQLQKSKLMESLGLIASGVAHDFNNLLAIIQGNAELASDDIANGTYEHAQSMLDIIRAASAQAADLTSQLLTYAGKGSFQMEDVNINQIIVDLENLLRVAAPHVELRIELNDDIPLIHADASHIRQIIMNLVINAAEACEDMSDGLVTISTTVMNQTIRGESRKSLVLTVSDNGKGMESSITDQIFEPFFTTKFDGRGLGLAAVFGIVNAHEGRVGVESSKGEGSTLQVILPESMESSSMVLVVDDEPKIRELIATMLEGNGYEVVTASTASEALDLYRDNHYRIPHCIIDYSLPGVTGVELYKQLIDIQQDLQVVYMSGYDQSTIDQDYSENHRPNSSSQQEETAPGGSSIEPKARHSFIQKPFTANELLEKVSTLK